MRGRGRRPSRVLNRSQHSLFIRLTQHTVLFSIREVNRKSNYQPDDQAVPVFAGQGQHQQQADQNAGDGDEWKQRRFERTVKFRICAAHD